MRLGKILAKTQLHMTCIAVMIIFELIGHVVELIPSTERLDRCGQDSLQRPRRPFNSMTSRDTIWTRVSGAFGCDDDTGLNYTYDWVLNFGPTRIGTGDQQEHNDQSIPYRSIFPV